MGYCFLASCWLPRKDFQWPTINKILVGCQMHEIGCPFYQAIGLYTNRLGQGRTFLVESGGMNICPKITLGYFWSPNNQFILNWATFGAQAGFFGTEKKHFLTFLLLYDSKDEMKSILEWKTGQKIGLQGAS